MNKLILFLSTIFLTFSLSAFSEENFPTEKIKQMTEQLVQFSADTKLKTSADQLNHMIQLAKIRNDIFSKTLLENPKLLAKYLIPAQISQALPNTIQPYIEKVVNNIDGTFEILEMLPRKNAKIIHPNEMTQYLLRTDSKTYYLHFLNGLPKNLKSGKHLRIREAYQIPAKRNQLLIISNETLTIARDLQTYALPDSFGPQQSLVFMLNFQDKPTDRPFTIDQVKDTIFNTVNKMFMEFSYGQTTVVGDVIDWTVVPINSTDDCDSITDKMAASAESLAKAAGYDVTRYARKVFVFPTTTTCGWAGLANLGGKPTNTWINGYVSSEVIGHELGHTVGLPHSNSLECDQTGCKLVPYGDYADTMGIPYFYPNSHFNAAQKDLLGWLGAQNSPPIQTVSASGTFTLDAYETANSKLKALKILKEVKADGSSDYYYIEFRQGIGFDTNIGNCTDCNFTKGVLVHQANTVDINQTVLLDKSTDDTDKSRLMALLPGKSFNDPNAPNGGVTVTLNSMSSAGAVVNVAFGSQPSTCKRLAPTMMISPITTQWVYAGGYTQYLVYLRNNDSAQCTPSTYRLALGPNIPNITTSLSSTVLTIEPGKLLGAYLYVSTRPQTLRGIYSILTTATNITTPTLTANVVASLGVIQR